MEDVGRSSSCGRRSYEDALATSLGKDAVVVLEVKGTDDLKRVI